jgi:hypothetical protein
MIRSLPMHGPQRQQYLRRQVEILDYIQARNATAAECHRKATLHRFEELGITLAALRCCQLE